MSSYFSLQLDTKGPDIELSGISYTASGVPYTVTVISNEELSAEKNEVYFVDKLGKRIDIDIVLSEDKLSAYGYTELLGASVGMGKIYAKMYDDVYNGSNLAELAVNVLTGKEAFYCCHVMMEAQPVEAMYKNREITLGLLECQSHTIIAAIPLETGLQSSKVEVMASVCAKRNNG